MVKYNASIKTRMNMIETNETLTPDSIEGLENKNREDANVIIARI